MADEYEVWLPFQLSPGSEIIGLEDMACGDVLGHPAQLRSNQSQYVLTVRGLGSEAEAKALLDKLGAALLWTATEQGVGIQFSLVPQTVDYSTDPQPAAEHTGAVDAVIVEDRTAIYRTDVTVCKVSGKDLSFVQGTTSQTILSHISRGAELKGAAVVVNDKKLKLSFDLYSLSHFESTESARFLTLCTALEVLAPSPAVPQHVNELIEKWIAEVQQLAKDMHQRTVGRRKGSFSTDDASIPPENDAKHRDYEQLANRLLSLKKQSHTGRIREYVGAILGSVGDSDANESAKKTAELYNRRGRLVHEGQMDLADGVSCLDKIIRKVLQATMKQARE